MRAIWLMAAFLCLAVCIALPFMWIALIAFSWNSSSFSRSQALYIVETPDGFEFVGTSNRDTPMVEEWKRQVQALRGQRGISGPVDLTVSSMRSGMGWTTGDPVRRPRWEVASTLHAHVKIAATAGRSHWVHETGRPFVHDLGQLVEDQMGIKRELRSPRDPTPAAEIESIRERALAGLGAYAETQPELAPFAQLLAAGGGTVEHVDDGLRTKRLIAVLGGAAAVPIGLLVLGAIGLHALKAAYRERHSEEAYSR